MKSEVIVIAHNLRSSHNVGSLLRTCEGLGVTGVFLTGYTPYPSAKDDTRLPYEQAKSSKQIEKTALGAAKLIPWQHSDNITPVLTALRKNDFIIAGLEQSKKSIKLPGYKPPKKIALILGNEVTGLPKDIMKSCDLTLEIPMMGKKESFNVVQAAAMALYHLAFTDRAK